jgi:diguanylate cyclase (GGDEF)-like protein
MGYPGAMRDKLPLVRSDPKPAATLGERELEEISLRVRRILVSSTCLTALIIALLIIAAPSWHDISIGVRAALTAVLLWSVVVTGYGLMCQLQIADMTKDLLRERSYHDEVTGVYNYRYLDVRLAEEAERTRRNGGLTGVLYLDLDGFKRVNDRYGHQMGNLVLRQLAEMLSHKVRLCDVFGRVGGDEFLVVMPQTGRRAAHVLGQRLCDAVADYSLDVGNGECIDSLRLSVGAAAFPVNGETIENVITAADNAVYEAKAQGGSMVAMAGEFIRSSDLGLQTAEGTGGQESAEGSS